VTDNLKNPVEEKCGRKEGDIEATREDVAVA
jgi:hypothetical protein